MDSLWRVPAVSDDGPGVRRVAGFDPAEEVEERSGVLRHAVVGPGRELELTHFPPLAAAALKGRKKTAARRFVHGAASRGGRLQQENDFYRVSNDSDTLANLFACGLPAISALIMTQQPH